jgi:NAD(P)-dependent dehydrogenase (short-subunit alcohol dehydrogenase family)
MTLLRDGLLDGRRIALSAPGRPELGERLHGLGADPVEIAPLAELDDASAEAWFAERGPWHALVLDAAAAFADGGREGLRTALDAVWAAVRAGAVGGLIPAGEGGPIVLIAPVDEGPFVTAARDALENLARTLSIEWARYGITVTAVCPGPRTAPTEMVTVVAYLISEAGRYFSGCRIDLGAAAVN